MELDNLMARVLKDSRVIAVVGHSDSPHRTSYRIAAYLREVGYTVYPVNPTITHVDDQVSYPSLADVPEPVDIVNVFRRPVFLRGVIDDAIAAGAPVVWSQLGVVDEDAARIGREAGLEVIMNRCIKVEHARLLGL